MKASQIKPGDVMTTPKGSWMVREVKNLPDYDHIGVKFAAGRTDPGDWYKIPRDQDLNIYRASDREPEGAA